MSHTVVQIEATHRINAITNGQAFKQDIYKNFIRHKGSKQKNNTEAKKHIQNKNNKHY